VFLDIAPSEILLTVVVAVVVIGPKDMPRALRTAGRWLGKMRRVSGHFRAGIETMIREAEMEDMEKKWAAQNAAIMAEHPADVLAAAPSMPETPLPAPSMPETGTALASAPHEAPVASVTPPVAP